MAILSENATGDEHKKLNISWKGLNKFCGNQLATKMFN